MVKNENIDSIIFDLINWGKCHGFACQSVYDTCHGTSLQEQIYYLMGVVKTLAENTRDVIDVTNGIDKKFNELKEFVDNYFKNLDVQQEINKKIDEMVADGSIYAHIHTGIFGKMLNIIELGGKNDGTVDISDIVNENTQKGVIFFPAGVYKVSKPLVLYNSIIGAGSSAHRSKDGTTTLVSEIEGQMLISVSNGGYSLEIKGFMFKLNGTEIACINSESTFKWAHLKLFDLCIANVSHNGVRVRNKYDVSRYLVCENVTIWGTDEIADDSYGFNLSNTSDSVIKNVNILGCKTGIYTESLLTGDAIHIWCGRIAGGQTAEWHNKTRGLYAKEFCNFNRFYTDTCKTHIVLEDKFMVTISNYMCINEPNFPEFAITNTGRRGSIIVDNLTLSVYEETKIQDSIDYKDSYFYTYSEYVPNCNHLPLLTQAETIFTQKNVFCEFSKLWARYGGYAEILVSDDAGNCVKITNTVLNPKKTVIQGDIDIYYEKDGYNYSFFVKGTAYNSVRVTPVANYTGNTYFNSLTRFKPLRRNYTPRVLSEQGTLVKLN